MGRNFVHWYGSKGLKNQWFVTEHFWNSTNLWFLPNWWIEHVFHRTFWATSFLAQTSFLIASSTSFTSCFIKSVNFPTTNGAPFAKASWKRSVTVSSSKPINNMPLIHRITSPGCKSFCPGLASTWRAKSVEKLVGWCEEFWVLVDSFGMVYQHIRAQSRAESGGSPGFFRAFDPHLRPKLQLAHGIDSCSRRSVLHCVIEFNVKGTRYLQVVAGLFNPRFGD